MLFNGIKRPLNYIKEEILLFNYYTEEEILLIDSLINKNYMRKWIDLNKNEKKDRLYQLKEFEKFNEEYGKSTDESFFIMIGSIVFLTFTYFYNQ